MIDVIKYFHFKYGTWQGVFNALDQKERVDSQLMAQYKENPLWTRIITLLDEEYPDWMKKIYKPPFVIFNDESGVGCIDPSTFRDLGW